jgi:hypothetical protein
LLLATPFAILVASQFIWRYGYYGYWLPNTFYDKVGATIPQVLRGLIYVKGFTVAAGNILVLPILALVLSQRRLLRPVVTLPAIIIAAYLLYIVLVGGDSMPAFRFCTPLMPLLCLAAALCLNLLIKSRSLPYFVVFLILGYNVVQIRYNGEIHQHIADDHVVKNGREVGTFLKAELPAQTVIATNTAGSIPYYSGFKTIDMLGLNDAHIAHSEIANFGAGSPGHEKGDGNYVLSLAPDIIEFRWSNGGSEPEYLGDRQIDENPSFHQNYRYLRFRLPSGSHVGLYLKNAYLDSLNKSR